jgi:rhodanese-related sulfurtransferase
MAIHRSSGDPRDRCDPTGPTAAADGGAEPGIGVPSERSPDRNREPPVRHVLAIVLIAIVGVVLVGCASAPATGVRTIGPAEAVSQLDERTVIDVRTPEEVAEGMIAGALAINLQASDFRTRIAELDRDGSYLLYCRSGNRSAQAAAIMAELGFTDVVDAGGYESLVAAGAATVP